ncbi:adenylate cyclase, terminal-differentiation specific-like [Schistocerca americana]|uniref:adenylate cyclase, terminal-differentiation specific-like n=1 Tax=Schistocerca americana TaxID=7009 RepID=UPI001F4F86FA|nr:adenylate cyclase, terminal-differentiation specific-like [Schistocerca americana]
MALSLVLTLAVWCCAWQTAAGAGALLPSYQLLLPFPAGPAAPVAAPASRLVVLLPGTSPQPLTATALDAAHQQVEAASARLSQVEAASARLSPLPPQPSRADFQARAQAQAFPQQQQQQLQQQQLQQQLQQLQDDSVVAARTSFQPPVRGRPDFQQQAARQQQADYQVVSDGRGEFAAPAGPQPMRPSGLGRALQTPSYQALVADYRFRQQQQQQLQQQASSYQPLATEYQYRQPQRTSYQGVSTEYQYRQQPSQAQAVSSAASRADFRPGPYPLPTPYSAARANLVQQQQQQQEYQQQQQQDYQQQGAAYDASRPEFRSLQPQGLLPGQEYSVNFEGDGFGYGYTIRGDHNLQRAY